MTSEALRWVVGVAVVALVAAAIGLRLILGSSGQRAQVDTEQEVATLDSWARSHGWQRVPAPSEPPAAQRVTVRGLTPLLAVGGDVDGRPAVISLWERSYSKLGSPVTFRTTTWVVSSASDAHPTGAEAFGLGRVTSGGATVGPPRAVADRSAVFPWGHGRAALWPAPGLPEDPGRLQTLAERLDALSGFLIVDETGLSINLPHTAPEEILELLRLTRDTLTPRAS